jgi:hypothetical protein
LNIIWFSNLLEILPYIEKRKIGVLEKTAPGEGLVTQISLSN